MQHIHNFSPTSLNFLLYYVKFNFPYEAFPFLIAMWNVTIIVLVYMEFIEINKVIKSN